MGLFEESSWGSEETGSKQGKQIYKKRKMNNYMLKQNISNSETNNKAKKKTKRLKKLNNSEILEPNQAKKLHQNVQKVRSEKKLKDRSTKKNLSNSSSNLGNFKKETNVPKITKIFESKQELLHYRNPNSINKKVITNQKTNSQAAISLKSKKRKLIDLENKTKQVINSKKRQKSKSEDNLIKNKENKKSEKVDRNILDVKSQVSKTERKKIKRKPEKKKNFISNDVQKNKSNLRKINITRIQQMLRSKKQEEKNPKFVLPSLRERMLTHLRASRFRFLNEALYSSASYESKKFFKEDPEAFRAYHEGYRQQVAQWPLNPLDIIIASIKKMPKNYSVADFGCGEAKLADSLSQTVHSFDLVSLNDKVKACDMAHTPLLTNGIDVVVFCLSLMGTNLEEYLLEANRVLKKGGVMKIAEVESRFDSIENFINLVASYGFVNTWADLSNDLFYFLDFRKEKEIEKVKKNKLPAIQLKPCLYKKR